MFMVLPVLATYGMDLAGATPALIGLAIGAYGLTQAIFQIPFGIISDRIGRRPVIYLGLIVFALGSVLASQADSIWGVIAGRILQGAGAISAAVMALLSDLTREQHRTKAMAMIGMSIGLSFAVAMVVGPLLTRAFGLSGLFWVTAGMALLGILIIAVLVPKPQQALQHREARVASQALGATLRHPDLLRLDFGIAALHAILMASFVALPLALVEQGGLPKEEHWWVYLVGLLVGFFGMIPFIIYGEKKRQMKRVLLGAVALLVLCELFFWQFGSSLRALVIGNLVFFTAFNLLEASLPSLISKMAPAGGKGTAMGVYSTSQFLGAALGGLLGGWLFQQGGVSAVFLGCALLAALWLGFAATMREPPYVTSVRLPLSPQAQREAGLAARLKATPGVADAFVVAEEAAVYVKVDTQQLDRTSLERLVNPAPAC
ncbi:Inner membrane transport protein YajR [compost metagenome]